MIANHRANGDDVLFTRLCGLPPELPDNHFLPWLPNGTKKVPVDRHGNRCDANDPRNWMSLYEARERSMVLGDSGPRIALALGESGLIVLDLDRVIDEQSGVITTDARMYMNMFGSYSELSQSGRGVHIIVAGNSPGGNRRVPGMEVKTNGILAITGHPLEDLPIVPGGAALTALVESLGPSQDVASISELPEVLPQVVQALIAQAWPNAGFRQLWSGDWTGYPTPSEADAALCTHLARNGGQVPEIVATWRRSRLWRDKLRRDAYCFRTALFACMNVVLALPRTVRLERMLARSEVAIAQRWLENSPLWRDTRLLIRLAAQIASGNDAANVPGFVRITPALIAGDYEGATERIMSREGAWRALHRLADQGIVTLAPAVGPVMINGKRVDGKITTILVTTTDFLSVVAGFLSAAGHDALNA